jgi:DNA modification methylase
VSSETTVVRPAAVDVVYEHDARDMKSVESDSVALVVTSPPYLSA